MKLKKILITVATLTILGCSSNQIVKDDIYTTQNITYNILTDKPVNGIVAKESNGYKEYYTYKKGKLENYKSVDRSGNLIVEKGYDSMGLLNGKVKDRENYVTYRHGILSGEKLSKNYGDSIITYKDGMLHGKTKENDEVKYYENGSKSKEQPKEMESFEKKIKWGEKLKTKNYTGELYSKPTLKELIPNYTATLEVKGYENGILKYAKYYTAEGLKIKEYAFYEGDINKISKILEFRNGYLIKSSGFNLKGELDGVVKEQTWQFSKIKNYTNGILQGETAEYLLSPNESGEDKLYSKGSYNLGIFTGERDGRYYVDGIQVYEKDKLEKGIQSLNIEDRPIGEEFSGLVKRKEENNTLIDYYAQGKIKKTYFFTKENLDKIITYIENGQYVEETYIDGVLNSRYTCNSDGVKNGPALFIEHNDSKTVSNIVLGRVDGKSKHYHGDKIYYIDDYKGNSYHRTIYFDYEKGKVENVSSGVQNEKTKQWITIGEAKGYYKSGAIKTKADYGEKISQDKKVKYTEYYENGVVKSKYTKDYCAWKFIGEKVDYLESGKIKEKLLYSEKGYPISKKEFNEKGRLIKETSYDGYGRVLETKNKFN